MSCIAKKIFYSNSPTVFLLFNSRVFHSSQTSISFRVIATISPPLSRSFLLSLLPFDHHYATLDPFPSCLSSFELNSFAHSHPQPSEPLDHTVLDQSQQVSAYPLSSSRLALFSHNS